MKNILFTLVLLFGVSTITAQDSKFYLGVGVGYASTGGNISVANADGGYANNYNNGLHINFANIGYRINKTWGITANFGSAGHTIENSDTAIGIAAISVGPMISFPVSNMTFDIKPQYVFSMAGVYRGDEAADLGLEDLELYGSGFIFGTSLVMGEGQGFTWSIDIDYLTGNFDEMKIDGETFEDDSDYNSLRVGAGVRYNF